MTIVSGSVVWEVKILSLSPEGCSNMMIGLIEPTANPEVYIYIYIYFKYKIYISNRFLP